MSFPILNPTPRAGELFGQAFSQGFSQTLGERLQELNTAKKNRIGLSALEPLFKQMGGNDEEWKQLLDKAPDPNYTLDVLKQLQEVNQVSAYQKSLQNQGQKTPASAPNGASEIAPSQQPIQPIPFLGNAKDIPKHQALVQKQQHEQQVLAQKERAESQSFEEGVNAAKRGADVTESVLDLMEDLADKNLAEPFVAKTAEFFGLPISLLSNPDSETFEKLSQTLTRGVATAYRGRILQAEFDSFARQIPTLLNSKQGRKQIIEVMRSLDKPTQILYKNLGKVIEQHGGSRPWNAERLAIDMSEPEVKGIFKEVSQKMRKISEDSSKEKGFFEKAFERKTSPGSVNLTDPNTGQKYLNVPRETADRYVNERGYKIVS